MEGRSTLRALLGVNLYEISENYIYGLRQAHKNPEKVFDYLPKYTLNRNENANNRPVLADWYLQFAGHIKNPDHSKNEKYLFFDVETLDRTMSEEIAESGLEDLYKDFDFKKILSHFIPHTEDDLSKFVFPKTEYLIAQITFDVSYDYYSGGYDCDVEHDIIGYLNGNLEPVYFEKPNTETNENTIIS